MLTKEQKTAPPEAVLALLLTGIGKSLVENFGSPQGSDTDLMSLIARIGSIALLPTCSAGIEEIWFTACECDWVFAQSPSTRLSYSSYLLVITFLFVSLAHIIFGSNSALLLDSVCHPICVTKRPYFNTCWTCIEGQQLYIIHVLKWLAVCIRNRKATLLSRILNFCLINDWCGY